MGYSPYNRGLGTEPLVRGPEASPPEAESFLALECFEFRLWPTTVYTI